MIHYMLDTDACIALIKNRPEPMRIRLSRLSPDEVGISSIVAAELWFGVALSQKKRRNEAALKDFLDYATILNWPYEACPLYLWTNSYKPSEKGNAHRRHGLAHRFSCPFDRRSSCDEQYKGIQPGSRSED